MNDSASRGATKAVFGVQIFLLVAFYAFAAGVITFLGYGLYRSLVNNDHWGHALIITALITFAFVILISVMTMIFVVLLREGRRVAKNGGVGQ